MLIMNRSLPALVRIKDKFQVTIPTAAREALHLSQGDYFEINIVDGEVRLKPRSLEAPVTTGADWYREYCARNPENAATRALTDADIVQLVKESR